MPNQPKATPGPEELPIVPLPPLKRRAARHALANKYFGAKYRSSAVKRLTTAIQSGQGPVLERIYDEATMPRSR